MKEKRRRIWIDRFQTLLFVRIAVYSILYQAAVWLILTLWRQWYAALGTFLGPADPSGDWVVAVLVLLLLAPALTYDAVRFAHRLVGPLYRFRKTIQAITAGEPVPLVQLRQGDFLQDMREEFNAMLKALEEKGLVIVTPAGEKHNPEPRLVAHG